MVKNRFPPVVQFKPIHVTRHHEAQKFFGPLKRFWLVNDNGIDIGAKNVANRSDNHVALFVNIDGSRHFFDPAVNHFPKPHQISEVARQFPLGSVRTGGSHDKAQSPGRTEFVHHVPEFATHALVFDFSRHADPAQRRHEHKIPARYADVRRKRRAFVANAFLDDLNEHFVAAFEHLLDRRLDAGTIASVTVVGRGMFAARPIIRTMVVSLVLGQQFAFAFFPVGHLPKITRLHVADMQKTVSAHPEIDERRLNARLQIDNHALVDIADVIVLGFSLNVKFFQDFVFDNRDTTFFGLSDIDQHFLCHKQLSNGGKACTPSACSAQHIFRVKLANNTGLGGGKSHGKASFRVVARKAVLEFPPQGRLVPVFLPSKRLSGPRNQSFSPLFGHPPAGLVIFRRARKLLAETPPHDPRYHSVHRMGSSFQRPRKRVAPF